MIRPKRAAPGGRIGDILRAVTSAYGGRNRVHRLLIEHASTSASGGRLSPLYAQLIGLFTTDGVTVLDGSSHTLTQPEAFVLTHAIAGVMRALGGSIDAPPLREVEDALIKLVVGFLGQSASVESRNSR